MRNFNSLSDRLMGGAIRSNPYGDVAECVEDVLEQAILGISQKEYDQLQSGLIIEMVYVVRIHPREKNSYVDAMEEVVAGRTEESSDLSFDVKAIVDDCLFLRIRRSITKENGSRGRAVAMRGYAFVADGRGYLAKTIDYSRRKTAKEIGNLRDGKDDKMVIRQSGNGQGRIFRDRSRISKTG